MLIALFAQFDFRLFEESDRPLDQNIPHFAKPQMLFKWWNPLK